MFDFLTDEHKEALKSLEESDRKAIKDLIEKHFSGLSAEAVKTARAAWEKDELQKEKTAAIETYKAELSKQKEAADKAAQEELKKVLQGDNITNIKRLFANISDEQTYLTEIEKLGLNKDAKVAQALADLGKRWEQEKRPEGSPKPPPTPSNDPLEQLMARKTAENK